jgi:hypothetical protein
MLGLCRWVICTIYLFVTFPSLQYLHSLIRFLRLGIGSFRNAGLGHHEADLTQKDMDTLTVVMLSDTVYMLVHDR